MNEHNLMKRNILTFGHWFDNPGKSTGKFLLSRQSLDDTRLIILHACMLLALLPHIFFQRPQIIAFCFSILVWQWFIYRKILRAPTRLTRACLILLTLIVLIVNNNIVSAQNSGVELLIMMMCLKYFEINGHRDWAILQGLCFFTLMTLFLYNSSFIMWLYSLLVVFIIFYSMSECQTTKPIQNKIKIERNDVKGILRIMLIALPLSQITFIVLPRLQAPLWGIPDSGQSARTGLADKLSPGNISELRDNNEIAFRVKFISSPPSLEDMYWRGPVFTVYDGKSWSEPGYMNRNPNFNLTSKSQIIENSHSPLAHYQVTIEPHNKYWLFALGFTSAAPENSAYTAIDELKTTTRISSIYNYEILPELRTITGKDQRIEPKSPRFLYMPEIFSRKTRALTEEITKTINPDLPYTEQMRDKILEYFTNNDFYYSRTPSLAKADPIDEFMFESRKGYCEHYASAFTFMMRAAGIPARVVTGYQGAEYNPRKDYYIVRQSNAHAWSEIWVAQQGWIRVDPTLAIPSNHIDDNTRAETNTNSAFNSKNTSSFSYQLYQIKLIIDALDYRWDSQVAGFDNTTQNKLFHFFSKLPLLTIVAVIILTLFVIKFVLYNVRLFNHTHKQELICRYYQKCCDILERAGFSRAAYETPNHFAERVGRALPVVKDPLRIITTIYCQHRYARDLPNYSNHELTLSLKRIKRLIKPVHRPS